jgi:hypothetical protein
MKFVTHRMVHDAVSLGKCSPTFRDNVVVLSAGFEVTKNAGVRVYVDIGATVTGDWMVDDHQLHYPCILHCGLFVSQCR